MADNYGIGAFNTFDFISNKTCYKACGYTDDDLGRPIIGIANSFNEMVSGHTDVQHRDERCRLAARGAQRADAALHQFFMQNDACISTWSFR